MEVRPIDGNILRKWCEKIIDQACHPATVQIGEVFLDKVRSMPTLTPPNEPLTCEELRKMNEEPVWIQNLEKPEESYYIGTKENTLSARHISPWLFTGRVRRILACLPPPKGGRVRCLNTSSP